MILCRARSHHVFPLSCLVVCWLFYLYISFRCNTCIFSWDLLVPLCYVSTEILWQIYAVWQQQFSTPIHWSADSWAGVSWLCCASDYAQVTVECFRQSSYRIRWKVRLLRCLQFVGHIITHRYTYLGSIYSISSVIIGVGVEYAQLVTISVMFEAVFTAHHLTDTDKTKQYRKIHKLNN